MNAQVRRRVPRPISPIRATRRVPPLGLDLVANRPHLRDGTSLRIGERPVVTLDTRHVRALFAAAHGDEHVDVAREVVGQQTGMGG